MYNLRSKNKINFINDVSNSMWILLRNQKASSKIIIILKINGTVRGQWFTEAIKN